MRAFNIRLLQSLAAFASFFHVVSAFRSSMFLHNSCQPSSVASLGSPLVSSSIKTVSTLPTKVRVLATTTTTTAPNRRTQCLAAAVGDQHNNKSDEAKDGLKMEIVSSTQADNKNKLSRAVLLGAVAIAGASLTVPHTAHALDLASSLTKQSAWWSSLVETGFYQAFSLVFVSEIGDKTFFIAGLLGMKMGRFISLIGSVGALAAMTIVSVAIGQVFHAVPSGFTDGIPLDDIAAVLAFAFFGFKTLKEALDIDPNESVMDEELAEAEEAVEENDSILSGSKLGQLASIFGLVFAAEFGDRSFLSTIALSAAQNPVSVAGGAIAAHAVATAIAIAGGSYVAKYISERAIGIIGGTLFLVFAVTTALGIF